MHFPLHHQLCDDETTDAASSRSAAKRLYAVVYWLMLDNITFATSLMATRSLLHQEAEKTATKIAVAAVAAAAAADSAASKQKKDEHQFRKRASSFIVK